jgi:bifunctional non-homologous end joining protein LigD
VSWREVEGLDRGNGFSLEAAAARAQEKDPWPNYFKLGQAITRPMVEKIAKFIK